LDPPPDHGIAYEVVVAEARESVPPPPAAPICGVGRTRPNCGPPPAPAPMVGPKFVGNPPSCPPGRPACAAPLTRGQCPKDINRPVTGCDPAIFPLWTSPSRWKWQVRPTPCWPPRHSPSVQESDWAIGNIMIRTFVRDAGPPQNRAAETRLPVPAFEKNNLPRGPFRGVRPTPWPTPPGPWSMIAKTSLPAGLGLRRPRCKLSRELPRSRVSAPIPPPLPPQPRSLGGLSSPSRPVHRQPPGYPPPVTETA